MIGIDKMDDRREKDEQSEDSRSDERSESQIIADLVDRYGKILKKMSGLIIGQLSCAGTFGYSFQDYCFIRDDYIEEELIEMLQKEGDTRSLEILKLHSIEICDSWKSEIYELMDQVF